MMSAKIRVKQVLLVEGKYDAAKLSSLVDGLILTTDGFGIYKDKEKQALLKELGRLRGVIILTDSDGAGFRIRNFVSNLVGEQYVRQAYVPAWRGRRSGRTDPPGSAHSGRKRPGSPAQRASHHLCGFVRLGAFRHGRKCRGAPCSLA